MTKKEFHKKYGAAVVELLSNPTMQIALGHLQEECPFFEDKSIDPTSIIRNEGKIQGWNACLRTFRNLYKSEPDAVKVPDGPLYADPDKRKSDQNRK